MTMSELGPVTYSYKQKLLNRNTRSSPGKQTGAWRGETGSEGWGLPRRGQQRSSGSPGAQAGRAADPGRVRPPPALSPGTTATGGQTPILKGCTARLQSRPTALTQDYSRLGGGGRCPEPQPVPSAEASSGPRLLPRPPRPAGSHHRASVPLGHYRPLHRIPSRPPSGW